MMTMREYLETCDPNIPASFLTVGDVLAIYEKYDVNPAAEAYQMEDKNTEADEAAEIDKWLDSLTDTQAEFVAWVTSGDSDLSTNSDGRNEIEHEQITAGFGKVKVTTSAEWRKRHLHQTAAEVEAARVQAEMLKGLR